MSTTLTNGLFKTFENWMAGNGGVESGLGMRWRYKLCIVYTLSESEAKSAAPAPEVKAHPEVAEDKTEEIKSNFKFSTLNAVEVVWWRETGELYRGLDWTIQFAYLMGRHLVIAPISFVIYFSQYNDWLGLAIGWAGLCRAGENTISEWRLSQYRNSLAIAYSDSERQWHLNKSYALFENAGKYVAILQSRKYELNSNSIIHNLSNKFQIKFECSQRCNGLGQICREFIIHRENRPRPRISAFNYFCISRMFGGRDGWGDY